MKGTRTGIYQHSAGRSVRYIVYVDGERLRKPPRPKEGFPGGTVWYQGRDAAIQEARLQEKLGHRVRVDRRSVSRDDEPSLAVTIEHREKRTRERGRR